MKKSKCICLIMMILLMLVACRKEEVKQLEPSVMESDIGASTSSIEDNKVILDDTKKKDVFDSIVQVQTDSQMGSGILWKKEESKWVFVTAAHVVEGETQAEIYFVQEEKMCEAKVHCVAGLDLAFLCVDTVSITPNIAERYMETYDVLISPEYDIVVTANGFDALAEQKTYEGIINEPWMYVEDFDNYMTLVECDAKPGMSGGGIFDTEGHLSALICGQDEKGMLACLSVSVLKSEYQMFINN